MAKKIKPVIWANPAKQNLQEIYNYIAGISKEIAYNAISQILDKTEILALGFEKVGQAELLMENSEGNYRYIVSGNYKIIYLIEEDNIFIIAIFDTRQSPQRLKKIKL